MAKKIKFGEAAPTFKRSAFPMHSGTTSHASALKQVEDNKTKEELEQLTINEKYDRILQAKATRLREEKERTDKIDADKQAKEDKAAADKIEKEGRGKKYEGKIESAKKRQKNWRKFVNKFRKEGKKKGTEEGDFEETKRQKKLKERGEMSTDEYKAYQAEKKEERADFGDALIELGDVVAGRASFKTASEKYKEELDNQIKERRIKEYDDAWNEKYKLPESESYSANDAGTINAENTDNEETE